MATLWVTEYPVLALDGEGQKIPIAPEPASTTQAVTFTTTTQSAAFGAHTKYVRIISSADCHLLFGANPVATTADQKLIAGQEAWRGVRSGEKVAAVAA